MRVQLKSVVLVRLRRQRLRSNKTKCICVALRRKISFASSNFCLFASSRGVDRYYQSNTQRLDLYTFS